MPPILIIVTICSAQVRSLQCHILGTPALSRVVAENAVRKPIVVIVPCPPASLNALQGMVERIRNSQLGLLAARDIVGRVLEGAGDPRLVGQVATTVSRPRHIVRIRNLVRGGGDRGASVLCALPFPGNAVWFCSTSKKRESRNFLCICVHLFEQPPQLDTPGSSTTPVA